MPEYIRVVAPATLKENFTFDVLLHGRPFTVVVPPGGVDEGEEIEVPYTVDHETALGQEDSHKYEEDLPLKPTLSRSSSEDDDKSTGESDRLGAPYGHFRSSLCSCCDVLTQSTFWMALCCFPLLVAQLLARLRLTWKGTVQSGTGRVSNVHENGVLNQEEQIATFIKLVLSFVVALLLGYIPILGSVVLLSFYAATAVWIGGNLRRHVRQRYRIQSRMPNCLDDRCTMCFCGCCALIQVARHTHDDKEYPGHCCSLTGLEAGAPEIIIDAACK